MKSLKRLAKKILEDRVEIRRLDEGLADAKEDGDRKFGMEGQNAE